MANIDEIVKILRDKQSVMDSKNMELGQHVANPDRRVFDGVLREVGMARYEFERAALNHMPTILDALEAAQKERDAARAALEKAWHDHGPAVKALLDRAEEAEALVARRQPHPDPLVDEVERREKA